MWEQKGGRSPAGSWREWRIPEQGVRAPGQLKGVKGFKRAPALPVNIEQFGYIRLMQEIYLCGAREGKHPSVRLLFTRRVYASFGSWVSGGLLSGEVTLWAAVEFLDLPLEINLNFSPSWKFALRHHFRVGPGAAFWRSDSVSACDLWWVGIPRPTFLQALFSDGLFLTLARL